jgi:hypothetical protein
MPVYLAQVKRCELTDMIELHVIKSMASRGWPDPGDEYVTLATDVDLFGVVDVYPDDL